MTKKRLDFMIKSVKLFISPTTKDYNLIIISLLHVFCVKTRNQNKPLNEHIITTLLRVIRSYYWLIKFDAFKLLWGIVFVYRHAKLSGSQAEIQKAICRTLEISVSKCTFTLWISTGWLFLSLHCLEIRTKTPGSL